VVFGFSIGLAWGDGATSAGGGQLGYLAEHGGLVFLAEADRALWQAIRSERSGCGYLEAGSSQPYRVGVRDLRAGVRAGVASLADQGTRGFVWAPISYGRVAWSLPCPYHPAPRGGDELDQQNSSTWPMIHTPNGGAGTQVEVEVPVSLPASALIGPSPPPAASNGSGRSSPNE